MRSGLSVVRFLGATVGYCANMRRKNIGPKHRANARIGQAMLTRPKHKSTKTRQCRTICAACMLPQRGCDAGVNDENATRKAASEGVSAVGSGKFFTNGATAAAAAIFQPA